MNSMKLRVGRKRNNGLQRWWSINFLSGPADGLSVEESNTVGSLWVQRVERARSPPQRGAPGHKVASRAGHLLRPAAAARGKPWP